MAKITTIIDIGSNSVRMVVFKKSSRFGFSLINETKSRVKISEGSYNDNGNLQTIPMQRAFGALQGFVRISKSLKSRKILCVATSALRDAPNKKIFISKVKKELGLNIKVIDGEKEAYYGAVATSNLLHIDNYMSIDIGGGSTEFCLVNDKKIDQYFSLDIGTVRLKELFFNNGDIDGAKKFIFDKLNLFSKQFKSFQTNILVGVGGSSRALSKIIIDQSDYPLDTLHGFTYKTKKNRDLFEKIIYAKSDKKLKSLGVKKDRFDTIKEGTFIFDTIIEYFNIKTVVTSGVGVREGVYLADLLRTSNHRFPSNFNISVRSLLDRFELDNKITSYMGNNISKIFNTLKPIHNLEQEYNSILVLATKLHSIGVTLSFYKYSEHAFNFILNGLNYGFSHQQRVLIAHIIKFSKKPTIDKKDIKEFESLLPPLEVVQWLSFMMSLNLRLNVDLSSQKFIYELDNNTLIIKSDQKLYLASELIKRVEKPTNLKDIILDD
jgi:exopolyphosphatase/guanosine-5'-triphosphate,3'-diphosphate pyrophosphatase